MDIQHEQTNSKGSFFASENGKRLAELTYSKAGSQLIIIDNTEVSEILKATA